MPCLQDADCAVGQLCQASSHTCADACNALRGCGDAGVCETDAGLCVERGDRPRRDQEKGGNEEKRRNRGSHAHAASGRRLTHPVACSYA